MMKKVSFLILFLCLGFSFKGFSQTTAANDFYVGKWEVLIMGTPNGDSKLVADLSRKDEKLTGTLSDPSGQMPEPLPISKVTEDGNNITIEFQAQGMDLALVFERVDADNLRGQLMGQFDTTAKRIK